MLRGDFEFIRGCRSDSPESCSSRTRPETKDTWTEKLDQSAAVRKHGLWRCQLLSVFRRRHHAQKSCTGSGRRELRLTRILPGRMADCITWLIHRTKIHARQISANNA